MAREPPTIGLEPVGEVIPLPAAGIGGVPGRNALAEGEAGGAGLGGARRALSARVMWERYKLASAGTLAGLSLAGGLGPGHGLPGLVAGPDGAAPRLIILPGEPGMAGRVSRYQRAAAPHPIASRDSRSRMAASEAASPGLRRDHGRASPGA